MSNYNLIGVCLACGDTFKKRVYVNGKRTGSGNRAYCFVCNPGKLQPGLQQQKTKIKISNVICKTCGLSFDNRPYVDGKRIGGTKRKRCFACLPFKYQYVKAPKLCNVNIDPNCSLCDKPLNLSRTKSRASGRRCSTCNTRVRILKVKYFAVEYLGGKCLDCENTFDLDVYDCHHVSGLKVFEISDARGKSWTAIKAELDKCILVCSNCHRKRHSKPICPKMMAIIKGCKNPLLT